MAAERQHPLAEIDLSEAFRRLTAYAISLYRTDRVMAGTGTSPADLASNVILELLQGKLGFDGRRPLWPLLKKAVYRDFLDVKKSAGRRTTVILAAADNGTPQIAGDLDDLPLQQDIPDVLFRESVYDAIGEDERLRDYAYAVLECGAETPADIASLLGTTTKDVENLRKRLRRAIAPLRARLET